ncbi:hypothetical protein BS297_23335 [Rhodococcus erythropolis]|uniref:Uncharacterized protein n=1 Tax=Rhodococcus erythropolis TaxID=1833 RepID=A0A0C3A8S6_RHOER|nr:hypothetical protein BS297_23335 [Rhodococcus erythropolis]KIM16559.1 hypothetical protein QV65_13375 [Rhodococcus erythropolis]
METIIAAAVIAVWLAGMFWWAFHRNKSQPDSRRGTTVQTAPLSVHDQRLLDQDADRMEYVRTKIAMNRALDEYQGANHYRRYT